MHKQTSSLMSSLPGQDIGNLLKILLGLIFQGASNILSLENIISVKEIQ